MKVTARRSAVDEQCMDGMQEIPESDCSPVLDFLDWHISYVNSNRAVLAL